MPISIEESKKNMTTDLDLAVIDEFRKGSAILDSLIFDTAVNPAGGGATLTYGYRRISTQATASTRAYNTEYTDQAVTTTLHTTTLAPIGASFSVDRVLAQLGPDASNAVSVNMAQIIKATTAKFQDLVLNGDTGVDANAFDGLDKALLGSTTEFRKDKVTDWTDFDTNARAEYKALDALDEFLDLLDGTPTVIVGNRAGLARIRAAVRRANMYTKSPVDGLTAADGRPITREMYGNILLVDAGEKAGSADPIIPISTRTVGSQTGVPGLTDLYAYRVGLDGFHAVATTTGHVVRTWLPDFTEAGAVKRGEVELGPVGVALKATKAAAVFRNIKVR